MTKKIMPLIALLSLLLIALTACSSGPETTSISVDMADFTFDPANVTVPAGSEVELNLSNSGTLEHEWVIMMFGQEATAPFDDADEAAMYFEAELQPGSEASFTFTAPEEPGEYQLVCGTPGHLEAGMVGTLTVTEP